MKGRTLVWLLMLACFCGGLALYCMIYREVQLDLFLFYHDG